MNLRDRVLSCIGHQRAFLNGKSRYLVIGADDNGTIEPAIRCCPRHPVSRIVPRAGNVLFPWILLRSLCSWGRDRCDGRSCRYRSLGDRDRDVTDTEGDTVRVTVSVMTGDSVPDTVATVPAVTVTLVV